MNVRYSLITSVMATLTILGTAACRTNGRQNGENAATEADKVLVDTKNNPGKNFSGDSAYVFVGRQIDFGPRVPGTEAHRRCGDYIVSELKRFGADTIIEQTATLTAYNGDRLPMRNILAQYDPSATDRIILVAHYDTRPWADNDPDVNNRKVPIDGANDGGSGVGVLLELARLLGQHPAKIGVDLLFVDSEDYGCSDGWEMHNESWAMGSQYFARNLPYTSLTKPRYGIVLDMVGGIDGRFHREYFSDKYAPALVDKVWATANHLGYGNLFINELGGSIIDDHIPLSQGGIPTIDIVECNHINTGAFPPTWHTVNDNFDSISVSTLNTVGDVVATVIYNERPIDNNIRNVNIE